MKQGKNNLIIIFLICLSLSVIFTFPFILHLSGYLIGKPLDGYLYLWNIDNFWRQIASFKNPFYTYNIFYPLGANLALNTSAPLISLFGPPFLKNIPLYINLLILFSFPLSAFFTYRFINKITGSSFAGFIAGLIYGFSPIMFSFVVSQHFYFAFAAVLIPIGINYCEDYADKLKTVSLVKVFLIFLAIFFIDYYTSVLYLVMGFTYILLRTSFSGNIRKLFSLKSLLSILNVLVSVFAIPLLAYYFLVFSGSNLKTFSASENFYPKICSARPADFITPSAINPILGKYSATFRSYFGNPESGDTPYLFLGWITVLITLFTLFNKKSRNLSLPFWGMGILVLLLSVGPATFVFKYFSKLPFMSFVDCPQRFTIGIQLSLAALVGIFFSIFKTKGYLFQKLLTTVFAIIFLIEYGIVRIPLTKIFVPKVYTQVAMEKNNLTVLELPSGLTESKGAFGYDWSIWGLNSMQMYWQTIYHKPKVGGYVSRIDEKTYAFFKNEPVISDLFILTSLGGTWDGNKFTDKEIDNFITKFNLGYIILSPNARQDEFGMIVEKIFINHINGKVKEEGYILYHIGSVK